MTKWQLVAVVLVVCTLCIWTQVQAAPIVKFAISDGEPQAGDWRDVPWYEVGGKFRLGYASTNPEDPDAGTPYEWSDSLLGGVSMSGELDPDPSLIFGATATDFGAPSNFSFTYILPLSPQVTNPSRVFDSFSGSVSNSLQNSSVSITALPPPAGITPDSDGITEVQVFSLSDDGGVTWKNVGLDLGPSQNFPVGPGGSGTYGPYSEGLINTIAQTGPWTHMRADINFQLSGGSDTFTFNGIKVLIPEPASLILALSSLGILSFKRRRAA